MQTSKTVKRLLAIVLTVAMMLTTIPFSFAADDAAKKDTLAFGTYNNAEIVWEIVEKEADGDLVLITKNVLYTTGFYLTSPTATNPISYATGSINDELNTGDASFYATSFSSAEKAAIKPSTLSYDYFDVTTNAKATGTLTANVIIPNASMVTAYNLGVAKIDDNATSGTQYWLADSVAANAKDKDVKGVNATGNVASIKVPTKSIKKGIRAMITIAANSYSQFPTVDGVTFTINDKTAAYYATTSDVAFKVVVDTENYTADNMVVALGGTALTAVDGVYTIPAGSTGSVTVTGLAAQPADFTAYEAAVAEAAKVDRELCITTDLDAALAVDVSACTKAEQATVDAATAAILEAIENIQYKPADTAAYLEALNEVKRILANEPVEITPTLTAPIYNLNAPADDMGTNFSNTINRLLREYEPKNGTPVIDYTIDKQEQVDEATAKLEDIIARVPLMRTDTSAWRSTLNSIRNLSPTRYSNAAKLIAEANAIAAEADYVALNLEITRQAEVDAATAKLREILAKAEIIPSDFTSLDAVIEIANTYVKENYYTEEEMPGAQEAWDAFEKQRAAAIALDRTANNTFADHQNSINDTAAALVRTMQLLAPFERLTEMEEEFINPTKAFFTEIMNFFGMINGLLVALAGLLPLVIVGELVLYDVFVMIGDEDLLAFVEKIGIKPAPEEPAPEEPAE